MPSIAALLRAGGESSRMGTPKPLLEWGETTLIEYQIAELRAAGADPVVAVLGHRADEVRPLVHRAGALSVINELYREGRASSARVGAAGLPEGTPAGLGLNGDPPRPRAVIRRLVREHRERGNLITVPVYQGQRGHPALFDRSLLPELREVREATEGLRAVVQRH